MIIPPNCRNEKSQLRREKESRHEKKKGEQPVRDWKNSKFNNNYCKERMHCSVIIVNYHKNQLIYYSFL